ncbi:MAG: TetR/AcrR family transcriptional regulator [Bdellovibrionales bacterium]|nr:TetR/AcrR family transcriptional regulator [Bdellovibrionales bacterium]
MKKMANVAPRKRGRPPIDLGGELSAKDKLIGTALRLFYRYGVNAIGVDRIIAESNVAKMTFFKHFPTKRDLILEFLRVRDQRFAEWFTKTLESRVKDKKRKIVAAIEAVEIWFKSPDFRGCAFINTTAESGPEKGEEKTLCLSHKKHFAKILEELAANDGYKNPAIIADQLAIAIDGATIRAQMDGPSAGIVALRSLTSIILNQKKE